MIKKQILKWYMRMRESVVVMAILGCFGPEHPYDSYRERMFDGF